MTGTITQRALAATIMALGLMIVSAGAQIVVTDFSAWSASGNLLAGSGNELEQDFNTSGAGITAAYNPHTGNLSF